MYCMSRTQQSIVRFIFRYNRRKYNLNFLSAIQYLRMDSFTFMFPLTSKMICRMFQFYFEIYISLKLKFFFNIFITP